MNEKTRHRDAWAASKQVTLERVAQATSGITAEITRNAGDVGRVMQYLRGCATFKDYYAGVEKLCEIVRNVAYNAHNLKLLCDLQIPPASVYTDHFINQFFLMSAMRRTWFVEGPTFCTLALKPSDRVLEIGCGTGYFTQVFFAPFAREIVAIDIDARAIETARRVHAAKNIRYEVMDARSALPHEGPFDVILWTPSIFAYTASEFDVLMSSMHASLQGLLCGWTFVEVDTPDPDVLWFDMKSLSTRLKNHFANVRVIEHSHPTIQPPRQVLVFYASNGPLPFDADWPHSARL